MLNIQGYSSDLGFTVMLRQRLLNSRSSLENTAKRPAFLVHAEQFVRIHRGVGGLDGQYHAPEPMLIGRDTTPSQTLGGCL